MELVAEDRVRRMGMSWSAVFAGAFVFLAIEATFTALAAAIFPSQVTTGMMGAGPGIWMIILSIISLYFGARAAAYLSGELRRLNGMYYGLVTFGLSIFASLLMAGMIAGSMANAAALPGMIMANAAWLFVMMILGGIAAGIGGAYGIAEKALSTPVREAPTTMRPAA